MDTKIASNFLLAILFVATARLELAQLEPKSRELPIILCGVVSF